MSKQLERILDLLLAENTEQAEKLLHEYVVSKARQEYERVLEEEIDQSGDFEDDILDDDEEIDAEEFGEADDSDDEMDFGDDDVSDADMGDDTNMDFGDDAMDTDVDADMDFGDDDVSGADMGDETEFDGDIEDKVSDLEAELEDLRLEFERLMGGDDTEADFGDDAMNADMDIGDEVDDDNLMDDVEYDLDEAEEVDEESEELDEATNFSKTASEQPMKGGNLKGSEADNTKSPYTQAPKPASVGKAGAPVRARDGGEGKRDHGGKPKSDSTHHNINVPHKGAPKAKDGKTDVDGSNKTSPLTRVKKPS